LHPPNSRALTTACLMKNLGPAVQGFYL